MFRSILKVLSMGQNELLMMQLYGGGLLGAGSGLLKVVFLAFLLAVPVFRPERIAAVSMYRRACLCFGLSIIVPGAVTMFMTAAMLPVGGAGNFGNTGSAAFSGLGMIQLLSACSPVLFGLSVIFALKAVVPGFIPPTKPRYSTSHGEAPE